MEQNIRLDVNHMMADMLGDEYGVTKEQLAAMQDAAVKAQHAVEANRGTGWLGWMNLPYNQEEIVSDVFVALWQSAPRISGTQLRRMFGLNSTRLTLSYQDGDFVFDVTGFGHRVGMSQYGAQTMARLGFSYQTILQYYYQGAEVERQ